MARKKQSEPSPSPNGTEPVNFAPGDKVVIPHPRKKRLRMEVLFVEYSADGAKATIETGWGIRIRVPVGMIEKER